MFGVEVMLQRLVGYDIKAGLPQTMKVITSHAGDALHERELAHKRAKNCAVLIVYFSTGSE